MGIIELRNRIIGKKNSIMCSSLVVLAFHTVLLISEHFIQWYSLVGLST